MKTRYIRVLVRDSKDLGRVERMVSRGWVLYSSGTIGNPEVYYLYKKEVRA